MLSLAITLGLSSFFDSKVGIIITVGVVAVGCLVALLWAVVKKRREKRAAAFGGDLQQQSAATPGGISDPARRARLEDLRKNFEKGVETFRAAGKNLYDVPWYVIVGEPGAGKTEAIRHSNVGFPPGMQDEFQGVGGTINMNWWFTNDAVILDTAGRLLFEEVEAGSTSEWRIFLEMLKKHRPNCPINGLILAIPAESLVKDTPEQIQKKAGKIATQLETIQKKLDVRFPAYVVITKCDLLNGFREFFDNLTDPQAQHQMMGWSNPDPLDAPFRVDLVDEHIYTVVQRLRRRRQGLMLDPVARAEQRRTDEVDRLFSLPHSVSLIAPNLRQYLQTIFIEGAWSVQPLFLRGIYFTSSLREGSALDQELASALGLDVEALPEGKAWERESSFFLRDVFIEKTFRERGLVTRASNTNQLVMKRRAMLLGTSIAAGLALLGISLYGYQSLKASIRKEAGYWARASDFWKRQPDSEPIVNDTLTPVVKSEDGKPMEYLGDRPVGKGTSKSSDLHFSDDQLALADFHRKLADLAGTPLHVSKIFRLAQDINLDTARKPAQAVVFEDAVMNPLLIAAREKMQAESDYAASTEVSRQREADALLTLIRLEAALAKRWRHLSDGKFTGRDFLPPLFQYVSGEKFDDRLPKLTEGAYEGHRENEGKWVWPRDWMSAGSKELTDNKPIDTGLKRFIEGALRASNLRADDLELLKKVRNQLKDWQTAENTLSISANLKRATPAAAKDIIDAAANLTAQEEALTKVMVEARKRALFGEGEERLEKAYDRLVGELRGYEQRARSIRDEIDKLIKATETETFIKKAADKVGVDANKLGLEAEYRMFPQIRDKLNALLPDLKKRIDGLLKPDEITELPVLDELHLVERDPRYAVRWALYKPCLEELLREAGTVELVGKQWKPLLDAIDRIAVTKKGVAAYQGSVADKVKTTCEFCLERARLGLGKFYAERYSYEARQLLDPKLHFPLVSPVDDIDSAFLTPPKLIEAVRLLEQIAVDLNPASDGVKAIDDTNRRPLNVLRDNLKTINPLIAALLTEKREIRQVKVVLLSGATQRAKAGEYSAMSYFQQTELRTGRPPNCDYVRGATTRVPSDSPSEVVFTTFNLDQVFHFHFYRDGNLKDVPTPNNWTALQLLHQQSAQPSDANNRNWPVDIRPLNKEEAGARRDPAVDRFILFEFRFDAPVPPRDEWPTRRKLEFKSR